MGGKARAERLTPEERKAIARKAAEARWNADVPRATHEGKFMLGPVEISAAVLPDGRRLLTQATFLRALGRARSPKAGTGVLTTVDGIPFFLQANALKPFMDQDLIASTKPQFYLELSGKKSVVGLLRQAHGVLWGTMTTQSGELTEAEDLVDKAEDLLGGLVPLVPAK